MTEPKGSSIFRRLPGFLIPLALIVGAAGLYRTFSKPSLHPAAESASAPRASVGKDYYLSVAVLEVAERTPEGEAWDKIGGNAPDPYYEVEWRGTRIFKSPVREDTLLAKWSTLALDLRGLALQGGATSLDTLVQAARITISKGDTLEIHFYDSDVLTNDPLGQISFETTDLRIGDTTYEYEGSSVKRVVLRVTDLTQTPDVTK